MRELWISHIVSCQSYDAADHMRTPETFACFQQEAALARSALVNHEQERVKGTFYSERRLEIQMHAFPKYEKEIYI